MGRFTKRQYDFIRLIENSRQTPRRHREEILVWLRFTDLDNLTDILGYSYLSEGGIDINLQESGVVVNIKDMLEYLEIDEDAIEISEN